MLPAQTAERSGIKRPREHSAGPERTTAREHDTMLSPSAHTASPPLSATPMTATTAADKERDSESEDESARSSQSSKRRRESYAEHDNDRLGPCKEVAQVREPKTTCDLGDWEALKMLFDHAVHAFDNGDAHAAAHLLHAVLKECNRFLTYYQDPSVLFTGPSDSEKKRKSRIRKRHMSTGVLSPGLTPPEEKLRRDWGFADYTGHSSGSGSIESDGMEIESDTGLSSRPGTSNGKRGPKKDKRKRPAEHPTAFHTLFGSALLLYGILVARAQSTTVSSTSPAETGDARTSPDVGDSDDSTPSTSTQHTAKIQFDSEKSAPQQLERSPELETTDNSYPHPQSALSRSRPFPLPRTQSDSSDPSSSSIGPNTPHSSGPSSLSSFTHLSTHSPFPRPSSSSTSPFASRSRTAAGSPAQGPSHDARYYWYAALDVFEAGENVPARTNEDSAPTLLGNEPTLRHTHNVFDHPFHTDPHSVHHGRRHHHKQGRVLRQVTDDGKDIESPALPEGAVEGQDITSLEENEARREAKKQERRERREQEARESAISLPSSPTPYVPAESEKEDWRMAVAWGRTLVCLAQTQTSTRPETTGDRKPDRAEDIATPPNFDLLFPSVFASPLSSRTQSSASSRPSSSQDYFPPFPPVAPATAPAPTPIRISMPATAAARSTFSDASQSLPENDDPHRLLVRAMDQFARALLYVPRPTSIDPPLSPASAADAKTKNEAMGIFMRASSFSTENQLAFVSPFAYSSTTSPSPLAAAYAIPLSASAPLASRAYLLLSLASSVIVVAASLADADQRAYWGRWADGIIGVVGITALTGLGRLLGGDGKAQDWPRTETEDAELMVRADLTRARCWMMVGDAKSETLKDLIEAGKQMEGGDAAGIEQVGKPREIMEVVEECREAFRKAIELLEAVRSRTQSLPPEISSHIMPEDKLQEGISFLISQSSKMLDFLGRPSSHPQSIPKEGFETALDSVYLSTSSSGESMATVRASENPGRSPSEDPMEEDS